MPPNIIYRPATRDDTDMITHFVDYWLSGGAQHDLAPGGGQDYFVPKARHEGYLKKHHVLIALDGNHIVGWAVTTQRHSLIHLLVAGDCRGHGVGQEMLRILNPELIRSKIDQSTGDPTGFYQEHGYDQTNDQLGGEKSNIRILARKTDNPKKPRTIENMRFTKDQDRKNERPFTPTNYLKD